LLNHLSRSSDGFAVRRAGEDKRSAADCHSQNDEKIHKQLNFQKKGFPFHSHKTVVISLQLYAVVDSALCFAT
jgi:hypothetical protein